MPRNYNLLVKAGTTQVLSEPNYAGNIIVNLASLPDFLRKPILKKRMLEFFSMPESEQMTVINNALEAGPTIPFPNFSRLLKTWLEILATLSEEQRTRIFSGYVRQISSGPQRLVGFNLDGILGVYMSLGDAERAALSGTINRIITGMDADSRRILFLMMPKRARELLGL